MSDYTSSEDPGSDEEDVPSEASLSEVSASDSDSHDSGDESEEPDIGCASNKEARASAPQRTSRRRQTLEQQSLPVTKAPDNKAITAENGDLTQKAMRKSGASLPVPRQKAPANAAETDDIDPEESEAASQHRRNENIAAMLGGSLQLQRKAILPKLLEVGDAEVCLRKPFRSPHPNAPDCSMGLRQKLLMRKRFVPWGSSSPLPVVSALKAMPVLNEQAEQKAAELPPDVEPLILWEPPENEPGAPVEVDNMLTAFLRPHQREGVQFMFECVAGLRPHSGQGCILADDMGLGKTLQGITLMWTMLRSGHQLLGGMPMAKRIIICCPTSLVNNWDSECIKWLKGRVKTLPLCESSREDVVMSIQQFISPRNPFQVMIVSYETFRIHAEKFQAEGTCDLLICDEAHRLKNDQTLTNKALASLACKRRVLLSGTPLQNHLDEFYAMVNFCNPGVLGTPAQFRKHYEAPILQGREPNSTADEAQLGLDRGAELSGVVNDFILRRTNALLSAHLPPKVIEVVCCRMTDLQERLYNHFLASNAARNLLAGKKSARVLSAITALKKLCNHPKLIYDTMHGKASEAAEGFEGCADLIPPGLFDDGRAGRGGMCEGWEMLSGKFAVTAVMLAKLRKETNDRIVIVSNYTQTLDLFQALCRTKQYPCVRLDGSTTLNKRQKLVVAFNDPKQQQFVFLLSSKAGGCGLNLIGGNRLILFDPDWNPANDKQAAGRVWRDGQKKRVFVYRFLSTGTIEEKVYQRQLSKEGLQTVVNSEATGKGGSALMSSEELRDLFTLRSATASDTHDSMCCPSGSEDSEQAPSQPQDNCCIKEQVGMPAEEDLKNWGQHTGPATVPDHILQAVGAELPGTISFVFTCQVAGKQIEEPDSQGPSPEQIATGRSSLALNKPAMRQCPTPTTRPTSRLRPTATPKNLGGVSVDPLKVTKSGKKTVGRSKGAEAGVASVKKRCALDAQKENIQAGASSGPDEAVEAKKPSSQTSLGVPPIQGGGFRRGIRGLATIPEAGKKRSPDEAFHGMPAKERRAPASAPLRTAKKASTQKAAKTVASGRKVARSPLAPHRQAIPDSSDDE